MAKIRLKDRGFLNYDGKIIEAEMDDSGDVLLPDHIQVATGRTWAFENEYEVVNLNTISNGYTLEIQVENLLHLQGILNALPESTVSSAILRKN